MATKPPQNTWSGIAPVALIAQVRNTVPFLFSEAQSPEMSQGSGNRRYLTVLNRASAEADRQVYNHVDYFELCLVAHFSSVGGFVPTDVDNQIRKKIWQTSPDLETSLRLSDLVVEMQGWDISPVCARFVRSITDGACLSGLEGEWLGCAAAAYAASKLGGAEKKAQEMQERIETVLENEARIFAEHLAAERYLDVLRASTLIAHNLGDLDRVIDLWELPTEDPLRVRVYKLGHRPNSRFGPRFLMAGELNKRYLAAENHRNFPLREPRALRRKREYLLPVAPFLDDWGAYLASDSELAERELSEIAVCLLKGLERVKGAIAYSRALAGMVSRYPGGLRAFSRILPAKLGRDLETGKLYQMINQSKAQFERQWENYVPYLRKQIPGAGNK